MDSEYLALQKQKYLKYKNKYLLLKKEIKYNQTAGAHIPHTVWYDLGDKTLLVTSDLEGGNPFKDLEGSNIGLNFEDGLITDFKGPNYAFSFNGDLLDNNPYSIRLMINMIKLKEKYPDRVILIGGNRDFNKIRMGVELFIQLKNTDGKLIYPWIGTENINGLLDKIKTSEFEYRQEGVPEYLKGVLKPWTDNMGDLERIFNNNKSFHDRILTIYQKTLGITTLNFMIDELKQMFKNDLAGLDDNQMAILLSIIHMVMAFKWCNLPSYLEQFNGLYYKYVSYCHVIAGFTIGSKNGILSHGSMPITANGVKRKLTAPFGYNSEDITNKTSLVGLLSLIENEKTQLMREYIRLKIENYDYKKYPMFAKFIHLTALTSDDTYPQAHSNYSPVVWSQPIPIDKLSDIKVKLSGGAGYKTWIENDNKSIKKKLEDGDDIIHYNIFGHAPSFYNPVYYRENETLHINLDISKIEGPSNSYSFAVLIISPEKTSITGRIKFLELKEPVKSGDTYNFITNTGYETDEIKKKLSGKSHYYTIYIPETGPTKLLKTDKIPGTDYYVKTSGYNKLISNNL